MYPAFQYQLNNIKDGASSFQFRQKLIKEIENITGRALLIYAADFKKSNLPTPNSIEPMDKVGFSDLLHGLEGEPIDIFLHSPGGSAEATESIVNLIHEVTSDIRFIVPHSAKSAATLMALSGNSILMDHRSELGPIDPQVFMPLQQGVGRYVPAQTIIDGFKKAREIIEKEGPKAVPAYMPLISKYDLHLLEMCQNAQELSKTLAKEWLMKYMFKDKPENEKEQLADKISEYLADHKNFLSHGRPITIRQAKELGLIVEDMREKPDLQEKVWQLYCAIEHYFEHVNSVKLFENSRGVHWARSANMQQVIVQVPITPPPNIPTPKKAS